LSQLFSANSSCTILVLYKSILARDTQVFNTGFPTVFSFAIESLIIVQGGIHSIRQMLRYDHRSAVGDRIATAEDLLKLDISRNDQLPEGIKSYLAP
jgi:hypothetical protein